MNASRFRWAVVGLLFAITIINYIDRAAIAYAIPSIKQELGLSPAEVGTVLGAFGIGYAVTTFLGGFASDRFGARLVLAVAAFFWSLSIGATALATGLAALYAARVLLGVAEGPNFPALTGAISHWLAPRERATALGGALVSVPLALMLGGPLLSALVAGLGWRWCFGVLFLLSLAWVPVWLLLFRDDPARARFVNAAELAHIRAPDPNSPAVPRGPPPGRREIARLLLTSPTLLSNYWAFFVFGYFLFFFMTWLPSYLEQVYGLTLKGVGLFSVLPWAAAAIVLGLVGRWSDVLLRRTGSLRVARSYFIAGSQFLAALAVVPVALTDDLGVAIGGITVAVAASMGANAVYYAVNIDVVPARAATALGVMDFAFALAGFAAPVATGWVLDLRGSFADCFLLMAGLAISSVISVLLFHRPDREKGGT